MATSRRNTFNDQHVARWFFLLGSLLLLFIFWQIVQPYVLVLISAGITAVVLVPLDQRMEHFLKHPRIRAFLLASLVFLVVVLPIFLLSLLIIYQTREVVTLSIQQDGLLKTLNQNTSPLGKILSSFLRDTILAFNVDDLAQKATDYILSNLGALFKSTAELAVNTFIYFLSVYYFLVERTKIKAEIIALSPFKDRLDERIISRIVMTVRGTMFGALMIALIQGTTATIGLTLFGVPGAFLWGAVTVIASQVPILGVGLVMAPCVLYLFATGQTYEAIGLLIWGTTAVGLVDNILGPLLIKGQTNMNGLLILISVLGGIQLFGPIGLIMGPTILAAIMVMLELYKNGILDNKSTVLIR